VGETTAIGWTDHTFNGWWGCSRVSPGCRHCYAETFSVRLGKNIWGEGADRRFFGDKHWAEPLRWDRKAREAGHAALVFSASMSDVFEDRGDLVDPRARLFALIGATPHLQWQLLTKRPENVLSMVEDLGAWPANAWIGATCEDQRRADQRIPHLLAIPAPVRFLSCEPLLGRLDLSRWLRLERRGGARGGGGWAQAVGSASSMRGIGWIICGGESGPKYRPLELDWARDLRDQAAEAVVPFFYKQTGGRTPAAGGDELDGRRHKAFPPQAERDVAA
jgi:protein gp37